MVFCITLRLEERDILRDPLSMALYPKANISLKDEEVSFICFEFVFVRKLYFPGRSHFMMSK